MGGGLKAGYQVTSEVTLVRRLGAGGMGTVWLAKHAKLGGEVVVKFLSESLTSDTDACARFAREVSATVQVRSPHVVQLLDHGITESGVPYLVMEHLEGQDLSKVLRQRGTLRPDEAMHVIDGLTAALTKAHERGIVHRDIKPANVFLCAASPRPFVKLVDFGIAKRLEDETMTATNALLGTPQYMSPEQMKDTRTIDHRTDLWALGILTHHMLTGGPPFRGSHLANVVHQILTDPTPKITAACPELPAAIDAWLERALERDPEKRFSSARDLGDSLALALGDLAYATTRRLEGSGPSPVIVLPASSGSLPPSPPSAPSLSPTGETTLGPSAITQTPYGQSPRTKWVVMAIAALVVILVGAAFRIGYGLRAPPVVASAPPSATTPLPPSASLSSSMPVASGSAAPTTSVVVTSSPPSSSVAPSTLGKKGAPTKPRGGKQAPHVDEDTIGF